MFLSRHPLQILESLSVRDFSYCLPASRSHLFVAVDASTLAPVTMFKQQRSTVTEVSYLPSNPSIALSCSNDGTVCIFDLRSNSCVHMFNESGHEFCSLSANNSGVVLAAASLNKTFLWDLRTMSTWRTYDDLHTEDLTHVRFHPAHSHLLCTSSVDGLVNIMDNTKVLEEEYISVTLSVDTSVSKFGFVGAGGEGLYVTTDIHGVQLWNLTTADRVCFVDDARPSMTANVSGCDPIEMNYVIDGVFNATSNATGLFAGSDSGDIMVCSLVPCGSGLQISQSAFGRGIHSDVVRCCLWNEAVRVVCLLVLRVTNFGFNFRAQANVIYSGSEDGSIAATRFTA
jgi:WD40 repeat protein